MSLLTHCFWESKTCLDSAWLPLVEDCVSTGLLGLGSPTRASVAPLGSAKLISGVGKCGDIVASPFTSGAKKSLHRSS